MKHFLVVICCLHFGFLFSQENKDREEAILEAKQFVATGNDVLVQDGNFPKAEGEYRKAIAKNPASTTAKYNLANAYYTSEKYDEATQRYADAVKVATSKSEKHKAFHNQGNTFMEQKKYKEAVEAYKNALRNNTRDEETRYNLALAKKMLEEEEKKNDQNKDDDGQDEDQNKDQQDNKDQKEGDDKEEKKGDEGDKENEEDKKDGENKDGEDKEEEKKDEGDEEKDDKGDAKDDKKDPKDDQKDGEGTPQDQKPQQVQGQLSPQQVKSLLEAMNNEEKKVQDKINAQKAQGSKVKTDKDW